MCFPRLPSKETEDIKKWNYTLRHEVIIYKMKNMWNGINGRIDTAKEKMRKSDSTVDKPVE